VEALNDLIGHDDQKKRNCRLSRVGAILYFFGQLRLLRCGWIGLLIGYVFLQPRSESKSTPRLPGAEWMPMCKPPW
jgi:hypothetical protein